jgi:hypothetical protein
MICAGIVAEVPLGWNPVTPALAVAVQLKVAPVIDDVNAIALVEVPEQIVWERLVLVIAGAGFSVKVCVAAAALPHSLPTTKETVCGPGAVYETVPGLAAFDVAGVPPGKVQA